MPKLAASKFARQVAADVLHIAKQLETSNDVQAFDKAIQIVEAGIYNCIYDPLQIPEREVEQ